MPLYCSTHRRWTIKTKSFFFIVSFFFFLSICSFFYAQIVYRFIYRRVQGVYVLAVRCRPGGIGTCLVCHWIYRVASTTTHGGNHVWHTHTHTRTQGYIPFIRSVIKTGTKTNYIDKIVTFHPAPAQLQSAPTVETSERKTITLMLSINSTQTKSQSVNVANICNTSGEAR